MTNYPQFKMSKIAPVVAMYTSDKEGTIAFFDKPTKEFYVVDIPITDESWFDISCEEYAQLLVGEYQYPIECKNNTTGDVVKFDSLMSGTIIKSGNSVHNIGEVKTNLIPHNHKFIWSVV
jgi:hypothetical protein